MRSTSGLERIVRVRQTFVVAGSSGIADVRTDALNRRHIPNLITIARLLLVPGVVFLVFDARYGWALALFLLAGLSDAVDGFLARYFGWRSRLGAILDPLADKTLIIATYLTLGWQALIPTWLVVLVILRDVFILGLAAVYQLVTRNLEISPSLMSKANTAAQITLAVVILFTQSTGMEWDLLVDALVLIVLLTTVLSGLGYALEFVKKTRAA